MYMELEVEEVGKRGIVHVIRKLHQAELGVRVLCFPIFVDYCMAI